MIRRLLSIVAWLALGHAVLAGLFWALLQVPESNVLMVLLSAVLAVLLIVAAAVVEVAATSWWSGLDGHAARLRRGVRALPAFIVSLAVFGVIYALTALATEWHALHDSEIDAWLIVHFKVVKSGWLHAVIDWALWFVRYGVGLSLALTLLAELAAHGFRALLRARWLRVALRPRRLLLVALWMCAFVWLPWQAVYWRPRSLPPTWLEPAFVAVKLGLVYLLANVGWALALRSTAAAYQRD